MPHTVKRRGTMETYRNEEQMQCLAKSEGCKYASGQPVSGGPRQHYRGAAALAVMLSCRWSDRWQSLKYFSKIPVR